jgi:hypothetical protein
MGALKWTATLEPREPAAAVILDDEQVTAVGEGEGAGVEAGDRVDVEVELDSAPREVEVPDAPASALVAVEMLCDGETLS